MEVDLGRPGLEMDLDVVLGVVLDRAHEDFFAPHLAPEIARQRDAVVERVPLRGDHHDRGIWIGLAQVLRAGLAGDAVAEDDVSARQLELERVHERAVFGIREIVSARLEVLLGGMSRRKVDGDVIQSVSVGLEPQRHQQLAQRAPSAGQQ